MFRGRFQLGQEIPLGVLCVNSASTPVNPDSAPFMDVYNASGTKVVSGKLIPIIDRGGQTGYFQLRIFLGSAFVAGRYTVVYHWDSGSFEGQEADDFEIMA